MEFEPPRQPHKDSSDVFSLFNLALEMIATRVRRMNPAATEEDIERAIEAWINEHPGAEHGDASGPDFVVSHRKF